MTNYNNIPDQLKQLNQWVCYKLEFSGDRVIKAPYDPNSIRDYASHSDPETWGDFKNACELAEAFEIGIGFVFKDGGGIFGIDIDSMDKVAMEDRPAALKLREMIWNNFPTYCEESPSGRGMHYIGFGSLPEGIRGIKDSKYQIEIYDAHRYFTVTGKALEGRSYMTDCQGALSELALTFSPVAEGEGILGTSEHDDRSVAEICSTIARWQNGKYFEFLMGVGSTKQEILARYNNDHSSADMALTNYIAHGSKDVNKAVEIFRLSPLWRGTKGGYTTEEAYINRYLIKNGFALVWQERERKEAAQKVAVEQGREIAARIVNKPKIDNRYNLELPAVDFSNDGMTLPPGVMGAFVKAVYDASSNPNLPYALAVSFAFISGMAGRGYRMGRDGCNVFMLVAGQSATGKTQTIKTLSHLVQNIEGLGLTDKPPASRIYTGAAKSAQGIHDQLSGIMAGAWFTDECASMLRVLTSPENNGDHELKDSVNLLYDAASPGQIWRLGASRASNEKKGVNCISIGIAWFTTLEKMYDSISAGEAKDGFLSRFIPIFYEGTLGHDNKQRIDRLPPDVANKFRAFTSQVSIFDIILGSDPTGRNKLIQVAIAEDAETLLQDFNTQARELARRSQRESDPLPEIYVAMSRIGVTAQRLAVTMAVMDNPVLPVIKIEHVKWAIQFVAGRTLDVIRRVETGEIGSGAQVEVQTIVRLVKKLAPKYNGIIPAGVLRDKLRLVQPFKSTKSNQVLNHINSALKSMEEEGRILTSVDKTDKRGRPAMFYSMTNDKVWET